MMKTKESEIRTFLSASDRGASKHRPFYWGGTPPQIAWLPPLLQ